MTPIRKWLLTAVVALALLVPLAATGSADPGDGGFGPASYSAQRDRATPPR